MILELHPHECRPGDVILDGPYGERTVLEVFRPSRRYNTVSLLHMEPGHDAYVTDGMHDFGLVGGETDFYYDLTTTLRVQREPHDRQHAKCFLRGLTEGSVIPLEGILLPLLREHNSVRTQASASWAARRTSTTT